MIALFRSGGAATSGAAPNAAIDPVATAWVDINRWLTVHGIELLIAIAAGVAIYLALRIIRRQVRKAAARTPAADSSGFTEVVLGTLARTRHFFLIMASARIVVGYANPPAVIDQTLRFLFIVAVALQAAIWAREVIMTLIRRRAALNAQETLGNALSLINVLVSVALFAIAGIVVLDNLGVNVTGLIAGLGIGGIAIGLAAQGIFGDLFAALAIIFDRPFRIGDAIGYDQTNATVEKIGLKSTRLRSVSGQQLIIANTKLLEKEIANYERLDRRRVSFLFGLAYETAEADLRAVPALAQALVADARHDFIRCGLIGFNASSLDFELVLDVASDDFNAVQAARHDVAVRLLVALRDRGIAFAYPTQVSYTAAPDGALVLPYAAPDPRLAIARRAAKSG